MDDLHFMMKIHENLSMNVHPWDQLLNYFTKFTLVSSQFHHSKNFTVYYMRKTSKKQHKSDNIELDETIIVIKSCWTYPFWPCVFLTSKIGGSFSQLGNNIWATQKKIKPILLKNEWLK